MDAPFSARQAPLPPPALGLDLYPTAPLLNRRAILLGLTITFMACSWICCLIRLYIRCVVKRTPGWDDFFIILALLSTTTGSVVLCVLPNMGLGKPVILLSLEGLQTILKYVYIGTFTYPLSTTFIKIALLLQYIRAFNGPRIRKLCKYMAYLTTLHGAVFCVCTWFSCWPIPSFWDISIAPQCWGFGSREKSEFTGIMVTQVATTSALDIVVFLIPTWLLFRPETQRPTRLTLLALFILGMCAIVCSLWRVGYMAKLGDRETPFDPSWDNPTMMGLASFELHLAAICAALPVMWPVLKTTWNRLFQVHVTFEVSVTQEYGGVFPKFPKKERVPSIDIELQSGSRSADPNAEAESANHQPEENPGWDPYVGDETTGLGENETVVQSLSAAKRSRLKGIFLEGSRS